MPITDDFAISWTDTPLKDLPENYGWSLDATINGKVCYRMYYNNSTSRVYVHDMLDDQYYLLPDGSKHRGYLIVFKLNNLRRPVKK